MRRQNWKFEYTGKALAAAAAEKRDQRKERLKWWLNRKEEIFKDIRGKGITIEEGNASRLGTLSNDVNAIYKGRLQGPQVVVNEALERELEEAHNRIQINQEAVAEYEGWHQVMSANPDQVVKLNHNDWLYFFGK